MIFRLRPTGWSVALSLIPPRTVISRVLTTIKGGYRRAEKSRKVLMMMKAAKLGWAGSGAGQEQTMSRPGAGWEHARSRPGAMQEQGRSKSWAGALAVHIPNFIQIVLKT